MSTNEGIVIFMFLECPEELLRVVVTSSSIPPSGRWRQQRQLLWFSERKVPSDRSSAPRISFVLDRHVATDDDALQRYAVFAVTADYRVHEQRATVPYLRHRIPWYTTVGIRPPPPPLARVRRTTGDRRRTVFEFVRPSLASRATSCDPIGQPRGTRSRCYTR